MREIPSLFSGVYFGVGPSAPGSGNGLSVIWLKSSFRLWNCKYITGVSRLNRHSASVFTNRKENGNEAFLILSLATSQTGTEEREQEAKYGRYGP